MARDLGWIRACGSGPLLAGCLFASGCSSAPAAPQVSVGPAGSAGGGEFGPSAPGASAGPGSLSLDCSLTSIPNPVFGTQMFDPTQAARAELFAWMTDAQAAALRADHVLFPDTSAALPASYTLHSLSLGSEQSLALLASALSGDAYSHGRLAWPEPWAIRSAVNPKDPGGNLLRIVLKAEAWLAVVREGNLSVVDLQNQPVAVELAAQTPTRIGAVYYEHDTADGGPSCDQAPSDDIGFRVFIVANPSMVQEWSLATQVIADHLSANIDQLSRFLVATRDCPNQTTEQFWSADVPCDWGTPASSLTTEEFAYRHSLAVPSIDYFSAPSELEAQIVKLQGDLFEPDPMVVTPGSP